MLTLLSHKAFRAGQYRTETTKAFRTAPAPFGLREQFFFDGPGLLNTEPFY